MPQSNTVQHGIALMREFHSKDGLDTNATLMLESLGDAGVATLSNIKLTDQDRKKFLMVILRSACQIGRAV